MRRILFGLGTQYLPVNVIGANLSVHALCKRLQIRGRPPDRRDRLFIDRAQYAALAEGANAQAARPDYRPEAAVERLLEFIAS